MIEILCAAIVAAAVAWAGWRVSIRSADHRGGAGDTARLLALFAPGIAAAADDPRALLTWQPLALTARRLFAQEFAEIDKAAGGTFPFSVAQIEAAHSRWTADWLAWERTHDADFKLKATLLEEELGERKLTPVGRARLEAVEREKLERYQRRYEEYVRTGKALQALLRP